MSSIWGPIVSGLVATGIVYMLSRAGRRPAKRDGTRRVLSYGIGFKLFAVLLVPGSLFVAYAASHARPSQVGIAFCVAAGFVAAALFSTYQAFFVHSEYDEANIYYRSPLAGSHRIPWSEVREVGYSAFAQSHYIRTERVRRIWCSTMLVGYEELGEFLSKKAEELFGADS
jgi:hypothetical protein